MPPQIDPRLMQAIEQGAQNLLQAIFTFQTHRTLSKLEVAGLVNTALDHAEQASGQRAQRIKVFHNLQSMAVEAQPAFLRALLENDQIDSAMLNASETSLMGHA